MAEPPEFNLHGVIWGHTVLLQALIVQLMESGALTVEAAQRVFALAFLQTAKEINQLPDASRYLQYVHESLKWDDYYRTDYDGCHRRKALQLPVCPFQPCWSG